MPPRIKPKQPIRLYIAEWRENRGLTQRDIGERLGEVSHVTISRWENGTRLPDLNAQAAIAEALDIDVLDLHRHPKQPSADALLADQPQEIRDLALKLVQSIRREKLGDQEGLGSVRGQASYRQTKIRQWREYRN